MPASSSFNNSAKTPFALVGSWKVVKQKHISSPIPLPINLFQILNRHFGGESVEDEPVAVHGFGRGLAIDFLAVLACGEVPETVEITRPIEHLFIVHGAALGESGGIGDLCQEIFFACPLHAVELGIKTSRDLACHKRFDEGHAIVTVSGGQLEESALYIT